MLSCEKRTEISLLVLGDMGNMGQNDWTNRTVILGCDKRLYDHFEKLLNGHVYCGQSESDLERD